MGGGVERQSRIWDVALGEGAVVPNVILRELHQPWYIQERVKRRPQISRVARVVFYCRVEHVMRLAEHFGCHVSSG